MKHRACALLAAAAVPCAVAAVPAAAQTVQLTPLVDARLRYEHVDQDGVARPADALTLRLRDGVAATRGRLSALVEGEATLALIGRYDDGLHGPSPYPGVGDPQDIALYRAQIQYASKPLTLTGGRQRIQLDDERFVGSANWRQNGRTFDAVRLQSAPLPGLKADVSFAWSVRTTSGIDGTAARPAAIDGHNAFVNLAYATPLGTLTGFSYLVDQNEAAVQNFALSSQTYGGRLAGSRALAKAVKLSWQISGARQSDYHRNPNRYEADYYLIDAGLDVAAAKLGAGYEVLGADRGVALTSFQTPVASAFKFQGWADKFTTTPANGVRDLYASAGWGWKSAGPFKPVLLQAAVHRFDSDRASLHYGDELDLLASAKWKRWVVSARYADYRADRFATDTRKVWLELDWVL